MTQRCHTYRHVTVSCSSGRSWNAAINRYLTYCTCVWWFHHPHDHIQLCARPIYRTYSRAKKINMNAQGAGLSNTTNMFVACAIKQNPQSSTQSSSNLFRIYFFNNNNSSQPCLLSLAGCCYVVPLHRRLPQPLMPTCPVSHGGTQCCHVISRSTAHGPHMDPHGPHMDPHGPPWTPHGPIWTPHGPTWTHMDPHGTLKGPSRDPQARDPHCAPAH
jgi:hypothetical protein